MTWIIDEVRRTRLRSVIDEKFNGKAARMAVALGMKPPQLHRWLNGGQGIHEDSARSIEDKLGLLPRYLDTLEDNPVEALKARIERADEATRTLIALALSDSDNPPPAGLSPSVRAMVEMARAALRAELEQKNPPPAP